MCFGRQTFQFIIIYITSENSPIIQYTEKEKKYWDVKAEYYYLSLREYVVNDMMVDWYVGWVAVAQWIELATSGQEVMGSISPPASYWLGLGQYNVTGWDRKHGIPALSLCGSTLLSDVNPWTRPRDSLVADKDVKEPIKQGLDLATARYHFSTKLCPLLAPFNEILPQITIL